MTNFILGFAFGQAIGLLVAIFGYRYTEWKHSEKQ